MAVAKSLPTKQQSLKRFLKFLTIPGTEVGIQKRLIKTCPDSVIKSICNAAVNILRGEVVLTPKQKKLFAKHRKVIEKICARKVPLNSKRSAIVQKGKGLLAILPLLLSTAIGALGTAFANKE